MIIDVVLQKNSIIGKPFSYNVPNHFTENIKPGMMVYAPLKNQYVKGIVVKIEKEAYDDSLKSIQKYHPDLSMLDELGIEISYWISKYYICPLHKAINLFIPKFAWEEKSEDWVQRNITVSLQESSKAKGEKEKKVSEALSKKGNLELFLLQKEVPNVPLPYLKKLEEKGIITLHSKEIIPPYFRNYLEQKDIKPTQQDFIYKTLTQEQKRAYEKIVNSKEHQTFLLHGITGSGKTEVYLQTANFYAKQKKQTVLLVPEIALTPQLISYFYQLFHTRIAIIHSHLSDGERFTEWVRIKQHEVDIIIGSRSALFSSFFDLGCIILDEEHEWTYKNDQSPRYHTRNVASKMAQIKNIPLILGSATPDVESYFKAKEGVYELLTLQEKIK